MSSISNRKEIFKNYLIPLAQAVEVIIYLAGHNTRKASPVAERAFNALNLASCYVANPHNKDLGALVTALEAWVPRIRSLFDESPVSRDYIKARFFYVNITYNNGLPDSLIHLLDTRLAPLVAQVFSAINYDPTQREAWLRTHVDSSSVLTPKNRISKWRTFARHLFWEHSVPLILGPGKTLANPSKNVLHNDEAGRKAALLWEEAFTDIEQRETNLATVSEAEASVAASAPTTQESEPLARIPMGIQVQSTTDGLLSVEAFFDPIVLLDSTQRDKLRSKTPPAALKQMLEAQVRREPASLITLPTVVADLAKWIESQHAQEGAITAAYQQWQEDLKAEARKVLQAKLDKHFNKDEQAILATLLLDKTGATS